MLEEIKKIIKERNTIYKSVLIITALSEDRNGWKNVLTKIIFKDTEENISEIYIYEKFIIAQISMTVDESLKLLDHLISNGFLKIKNCPEVIATGTFDNSRYMRHCPSNHIWLKNEWPLEYFAFIPDDNSKGRPQNDALIGLNLPYFPNVQIAVKNYLGINYYEHSNSIFILLPNYQFKIDKIEMSSQYLDLYMINRIDRKEEIIGKLFYEKEEFIRTEDLHIIDTHYRINLELLPDNLGIYLLNKDGEILDHRDINKWGNISKDITINIQEDDIDDLIKQGENSNIEFKPHLHKDEDKKEFSKTVIAFSNKKGGGGNIIIGVDDHGNKIGYGLSKQNAKKIKDTITNIIRDNCYPDIDSSTMNPIELEKDKYIIVVRINEGKDKPYTLKENNNIYIRRNATDMVANRHELDEIYMNKNNKNANTWNG